MPAKGNKVGTQRKDEEPLVDTTIAIPLRSKRTNRLQKKRHLKKTSSKQHATLWDLPYEIILDILTLLRPSDIFKLSRTNKVLRTFVTTEEAVLTRKIIARRYAVLSKCFLPPVLLKEVDQEAKAALLLQDRQTFARRAFQHIQLPNIERICTCWNCILAWNNLNVLVDFAHWQHNLDEGEPIPMIQRGRAPKWNQKLISANARIVDKSLESPLWYARILECHLKSTVGSIRRQAENKGNKRSRFRMTVEDAASETDQFLERSGPPTMHLPFHRDNYYMLEAYLPNRGWNAEESVWKYMPSQHERDLERTLKYWKEGWAEARRLAEQEAEDDVEDDAQETGQPEPEGEQDEKQT